MKRLRLLVLAALVALTAASLARSEPSRPTVQGEPQITFAVAKGGNVIVLRGIETALEPAAFLPRSSQPALSADGTAIAYLTEVGRTTWVNVRLLRESVSRVVANVPDQGVGTSLAFSPKGDRLYIASPAGVSVVPVVGGAAAPVPVPRTWRGSRYGGLTVASDGRTLAASRTWGDGKAGTLRNEAVAFSPDGRRARSVYHTRNAYAFQARPVFSPDGSRIAVSTPDPLIYTVPVNGRKRTTLFGAVGRATLGDPLFSPDGTQVAYARTPQRGVADIYVVPATGGIPRRVTTTPIPPRGVPRVGSSPLAWSPDGTELLAFRQDRFAIVDVKTRASRVILGVWRDYELGPARWAPRTSLAAAELIAFERRRAGGEADLHVVRPNGRDLTRYTRTGDNFEPAWSPDGEQFAYVSERTRRPGASELYVMRGDGSGEVRYTTSEGELEHWVAASNPAWTSDGRRIAFTRREVRGSSSLTDLWAIRADDRTLAPLTNTSAVEDSASFAPDGTLVYEEGRRIWLRELDGSRRIVAAGREPALSPDGRRIAFVRDGSLVVVGRDGSSPRALLAGREPAWSPDGTRLVYVGGDGLFVTRVDAPRAERLTRSLPGGADVAPTWRAPLPE